MDAVRLRQLVCYLPKSGMFFRRDAYQGRCRVLGSCAADGYIAIRIDAGAYLAHRLAWLYVYGEWPTGEIDHINHNRSDNRISNLRDVTGSENSRNRQRETTGVTYHKRASKWQAQICLPLAGTKYLGLFSTREMAAAAYRQAAENLL